MGGADGLHSKIVDKHFRDPFQVFTGRFWRKKREKFEPGLTWRRWDWVVYDVENEYGTVAALRFKVVFDLVLAGQ
jgi:hypothetical protein